MSIDDQLNDFMNISTDPKHISAKINVEDQNLKILCYLSLYTNILC